MCSARYRRTGVPRPLPAPSFAAILTRSASELACIFAITCPRCAFTVISLMPSSRPTCLFIKPDDTKAMTCRSRFDRTRTFPRPSVFPSSAPAWPIRGVDQFRPNLAEEIFYSAVLLNGLECDAVNTRRPIIAPCHLVGFAQGLHLADVDVQSPDSRPSLISSPTTLPSGVLPR